MMVEGRGEGVRGMVRGCVGVCEGLGGFHHSPLPPTTHRGVVGGSGECVRVWLGYERVWWGVRLWRGGRGGGI